MDPHPFLSVCGVAESSGAVAALAGADVTEERVLDAMAHDPAGAAPC